jgi:hypothetical protein
MYQSDESIIKYVSTIWLTHLIDTYTMTDTPDWYIHYDWYIWLIYTLWLILLIDTYTMTDTPDWYIHYHWYIWLIYTLRLIHLIVNQQYQSECMYQSGGIILVYISIRCINHSVCINQVSQSWCMYQSGVSVILFGLIHLIE